MNDAEFIIETIKEVLSELHTIDKVGKYSMLRTHLRKVAELVKNSSCVHVNQYEESLDELLKSVDLWLTRWDYGDYDWDMMKAFLIRLRPYLVSTKLVSVVDKDAVAKRLRAWLSEEYFTESDIHNLTNEISQCTPHKPLSVSVDLLECSKSVHFAGHTYLQITQAVLNSVKQQLEGVVEVKVS